MKRKVYSMISNVLWPLRKMRRLLRRAHGYIMRRKVRRKIVHNKRIVFLADYPQGWNSFKTVYEKMKEMQETEVILLAWIGWPYPGNNAEFWKSIDRDVIISSLEEIVPLESLHADVIFRQTPYDVEYPKEYSAKNICKISKLCYIPYAYQSSPLKHLEIEYNEGFFPFLYAIFCDNNSVKEFCDQKAMKNYFTSDILRFDYGFPRFDISEIESTKKEYRSFLWIPRWSLDSLKNDTSGFFLYCDKLFELFRMHPDKNLIIRPHPCMFSNFIEKGAMTTEEVNELRHSIENMTNVYLDESADYVQSFNDSDVLIADFSSLIIEYFMSGKPIVYCGDIGEFNKETQSMMKLFYIISEWDDLERQIMQLMEETDPYFEHRLKLISEIIENSLGGSATDKIAWSCCEEI